MQSSEQLSKSQYLIWAGQLLSPDDPLYNMPFRFDIFGEINSKHFAKSFNLLVQEADAFRLKFEIDDEGLPIQTFSSDHTPNHEYHDLSLSSDAILELNGFISAKNHEVFDLTEVCYYSALIKLSDEHYVWYLIQHHIITDAWACGVIYRRLSEIYFDQDAIGSLSSYAEWLGGLPNTQKSKRKEKYWNGVLKQAKPAISLYNSSNSKRSSKSIRRSFSLSKDQITSLDLLCDEADIKSFTPYISRYSIFMTVLAAYIFRASASNSVAIGSPALNRQKKAEMKSSGLFIEFFPIVFEVNGSMSLGELYQQTKRKVIEFLSNSGPGLSSPEISSYFSCVLNYIHASYGDFGDYSADSTWMGVDSIDPAHLLRLHVLDSSENDSVELVFDLNTEVFPHDSDTRRMGHFLKILAAFLDDRSAKIDEIALVTDSEEQDIVDSLKGEILDISKLSDLLFNVENSRSDRILILQEKSVLSYADVVRKVNSRIQLLDENSCEQGSIIALCGARSTDLLCWIYACVASGRTFLTIPQNTPEERLRFMLDDADAKAIVHESSLVFTNRINFTIKIDDESNISSDLLLPVILSEDLLAYVLYTSGSTGRPKGVQISRRNLANYLIGAREYCPTGMEIKMPFFSSIGFDLSITSMFLPLVTGGAIQLFQDAKNSPDSAILDLAEYPSFNTIKLTPSHLKILLDQDILENIEVFIVGGENFTSQLAKETKEKYPRAIIMNEYGPTEGTVACVVHAYDSAQTSSVPIGRPMVNTEMLILSEYHSVLPRGMRGELLLSGSGVSQGYLNDSLKTTEAFISIPGRGDQIFYKTGDIVSLDESNILHYHGREDDQLKISGHRIELEEIESVIAEIEGIQNVAVAANMLVQHNDHNNCLRCGLPDNYPKIEFSEDGLCALCQKYDSYESRVQSYFKELTQLRDHLDQIDRKQSDYDCIMLLSGGKDSSYALAKLVDLGFRVLAFTLDNGFISQEALANVKRICTVLDVDHHMARYDRMNEVFIESLRQFDNVCNGCFKTIYTLSIKLALEKNVPYIVTGLSRGQFFETRLTEELFTTPDFDEKDIDRLVLTARKHYHESDEPINQILDNSIFQKEDVFGKVRFLDFYRYTDVELSEMYTYLKDKLPWVRPSDTGRSTNCLINAAGIYVHKHRKGYSNYAFPYSWDVRVGHKQRDESLDEINEILDEASVYDMLGEIGFDIGEFSESNRLSAYIVADNTLDIQKIRESVSEYLPHYMIPDQWIQIDEMPLTPNGKVNRTALSQFQATASASETATYNPPEDEIQEILHEIWSELLNISQISIDDRFMSLGGHSLIAIRMVARINKTFSLELKLPDVFLKDSIRTLADLIEESILKMMEE